MTSARTIDCRGESGKSAGLRILEAYNAAEDGDELVALTDCFDCGLRIWLIEAGAKHRPEQVDGHWRLDIRRGVSPAQGTIPGLHHVMASSDGTSIWACERATRLVKLDTAENRITAVASIARKASHLAVDRSGRWIFVADPGANALLAVTPTDLAVRHSWPAPGAPQLPLVTDEGLVCVTGGGTGTFTIVRPRRAGFEVQTIEVGACPHDPVTSIDGQVAFVPCAGDGEIVRVDLGTGQILGRHRAGDGTSHLAVHPAGDRIYSANTFEGTLSCLSIEGDLLACAPTGPWAHQPAISPDGRRLYVANFLNDTLSVLDADNLQMLAQWETEPYPHGVEISPDGRWIIASGFSSDHLRVYDAHTQAEVARLEVGRGSSHIAILPDSSTAYVACSVDDHLARIDLRRMSCTARTGLRDRRPTPDA